MCKLKRNLGNKYETVVSKDAQFEGNPKVLVQNLSSLL